MDIVVIAKQMKWTDELIKVNDMDSWECIAVGLIFGMAVSAPLFYWIGSQT